MELIEFVRMLRRHWAWLALPVLLGWLAGVAVGFTSPNVYSATAQAFVSNNGIDAKPSENQSGSQRVFDRMDTYAQLVSTQAVAEAVIAKLKLDMTPGSFTSHVHATVPPKTIVLKVTAADANPERAAAMANATVAELSTLIEELETPKPGGASFVHVSITGPAPKPTAPGGSSPLVTVVAFIMLGFAMGIGLASLRDQSLRARPQASAPDRVQTSTAARQAPQEAYGSSRVPSAGVSAGVSASAAARAEADERIEALRARSSWRGRGRTGGV